MPLESITLDMDATFIPTSNKDALRNYHGDKAYEAFNTYCPEYDIMVGTQFRGGNVPPSSEYLEELIRKLSTSPEGIKKVTIRSDTAGYQEGFLRYCAEGKNERFGVIDFTVSCKIVDSFKEAAQAVSEKEWKPVMKEVIGGGVTILKNTGQEWAEVNYVPDWVVKSDGNYRFIAIRERTELKKGENPAQMTISKVVEDMERENEAIKKLHLTEMKGLAYKVFGIVTDIQEEDGSKLVVFHHARCGKSEEVHRILKEELGGGHVASGKFGVEAAWWNISVLSLSLLNLFKRNFLPPECHTYRPKAMRYSFFVMIGKFVTHAGKKVLKVYSSVERVIAWYRYARDRLLGFCVTES
ncbi:MAG: transposase [Oscillospiraceae bacterium]|nr:transposase [Oscillospiraceae bacterium]